MNNQLPQDHLLRRLPHNIGVPTALRHGSDALRREILPLMSGGGAEEIVQDLAARQPGL